MSNKKAILDYVAEADCRLCPSRSRGEKAEDLTLYNIFSQEEAKQILADLTSLGAKCSEIGQDEHGYFISIDNSGAEWSRQNGKWILK